MDEQMQQEVATLERLLPNRIWGDYDYRSWEEYMPLPSAQLVNNVPNGLGKFFFRSSFLPCSPASPRPPRLEVGLNDGKALMRASLDAGEEAASLTVVVSGRRNIHRWLVPLVYPDTAKASERSTVAGRGGAAVQQYKARVCVEGGPRLRLGSGAAVRACGHGDRGHSGSESRPSSMLIVVVRRHSGVIEHSGFIFQHTSF